MKARKPAPPAWDPDKQAAWNASRVLPVMAAAYFAAGRRVQDPASSPEDLHEFRLATKRFRYTLELFRPCYGLRLERYLQSLRDLQIQLGRVSDGATSRALAAPHLKRLPATRKRLEVFLENLCHASTTRFREIWQTSFDTPGRERAFTQYLARFAGRARAGKK